MSEWINGEQMRMGFLYAAKNLKKQKDLLNRLNVFPVADRDTGINMTRSVELTARSLPPDGTPAEILDEAYLQLLECAHGNSGTILTLFFEGFSTALPAESRISGRDLALAFQKGAQTAEAAVPHPMTGTILSVASQSAKAGISMLDLTEDAGLIFKRITDEAHAALLLTPFQNPILGRFQVIDSGAYGFCLVLDGFLQSFAPELSIQNYPEFTLPDMETISHEGTASTAEASPAELPQRYCTEFVLEFFPETDHTEFERTMKSFGEYYLCAAHDTLCKIHIHTNTPQQILETAAAYGTIRSRKIDDMAMQISTTDIR